MLNDPALAMSSSHETFGLAESENMGFTFKHHLEWLWRQRQEKLVTMQSLTSSAME